MDVSDFDIELTSGIKNYDIAIYDIAIKEEIYKQPVIFHEVLGLHVIYDFKYDGCWVVVQKIDVENNFSKSER
ncbi:hypothetical protein ACYSNR_13950 [Enterococcus sp. LJL128]|uniref:hypothetical protein n=1 Tax=Enterococcus sp. LJL51 TaxID=3416656 RepID=UPI003CEF9473